MLDDFVNSEDGRDVHLVQVVLATANGCGQWRHRFRWGTDTELTKDSRETDLNRLIFKDVSWPVYPAVAGEEGGTPPTYTPPLLPSYIGACRGNSIVYLTLRTIPSPFPEATSFCRGNCIRPRGYEYWLLFSAGAAPVPIPNVCMRVCVSVCMCFVNDGNFLRP